MYNNQPGPGVPPPQNFPPGAPPPNAAPGHPLKKKTSPLVWVLAGCGGLLVVGALAVVLGGYFLFHKAKQAGFDPDLWDKKPALAAAKVFVSMNPDLELVSADEDQGTITVRNKADGKTMTVTLEEASKGKITFRGEGEDAGSIQVHSDGDSGGIEVKSTNGSMRVGSGFTDQAPSWLPVYPKATLNWDYSVHGNNSQSTGTFHFATQDPVDKVLAFYSEGLSASGLKVTTSTLQTGGKSNGVFLRAEDSARDRNVVVTALNQEGDVRVVVVFQTKD